MQTIFALIFEIVVGRLLGQPRKGSPRGFLSTHDVGAAVTVGGVLAGVLAVAGYISGNPQVLSILPNSVSVWVLFAAGVIVKAAQLAGKDTTK